MKKREWCEGKLSLGMQPNLSVPLSVCRDVIKDQWYNPHASKGVRREKITCPVCKKRFFASVSNDDDGDVYFSLPPHKRTVSL